MESEPGWDQYKPRNIYKNFARLSEGIRISDIIVFVHISSENITFINIKKIPDLNINTDNGKVTVLIQLNLSAAFDTIDQCPRIERMSLM